MRRSRVGVSQPCIPPIRKFITKTTSREEFSDVQFTVAGKLVAAHRIILADRSEVFRRMFLNNEKNFKQTGPIPIKDISYKGFANFIQTIYYGSTPADPEICLEMIKLADMYDIQDIKCEAEESVIASITMKNVVPILITAEEFRAERIKRAALEFCAKNNVHEMNDSKSLASFPDLMIEVFQKISLSRKISNNAT